MTDQQPIVKPKDDRIYYGLLVRVGTMGCYQYILLTTLFTISMLSASNFFINPYLFYQDPYQCPNLSTQNCYKYVCSLPIQQRTPYLSSIRMRTMANYFGDMHCEGMTQSKLMQQIHLMGASVSLILSIVFSGILGRRNMVLLSLTQVIVGLVLILTLPTPKLACIGLFLWGAGAQTSFSLTFNFATEFTAEQKRAKMCVMIMVFFALGSMSNTLFFYIFRNWRYVLQFYHLLISLLVFATFYRFVESTPIQLIDRHSPSEALSALLRIADLNGVNNHLLSLHQIEQLQHEYKLNQKKHQHDSNFSFIDLFRYPSVRRDFFALAFFYFAMMFQFYAPSLLIDQLKMDIFIDGIINGVSQLLTFPILLYIATDFPRRKLLTIFFIFATLFALAYYLMTSKDCPNCDSTIPGGISLTVFFIFRFFVYLPTNFFSNTLNQTLPAQVRHIGIYTVIAIGRISTLIVPYLTQFRDWTKLSLELIFVLGCLLCVIASTLIRQTVNIPPPQIIEELKIKIKEYQYKQIPQHSA